MEEQTEDTQVETSWEFIVFAALLIVASVGISFTYRYYAGLDHNSTYLLNRMANDCEKAGGVPRLQSGNISCDYYISPERQVEAQLKLQGRK